MKSAWKLRSKLLAASAACSLTVACFRKDADPIAVTAIVPPVASLLNIAPFLDEHDPRKDWIKDLVQPRLDRLSNLKWNCSSDKKSFDISVEGFNTNCKDFIKANAAKIHPPQPICSSDGLVQFPLKDEECDSSVKPPILSQLRLPEGSGLYASADQGRTLKPQTPAIPEIHFSDRDAWLKAPDLKTWLAAAGFNGAILLTLQNTKADAADSALTTQTRLLKDFLARLRAPQLLRPTLELAVPSTELSPAIKNSPKIPFLKIHDDYTDPLFSETCRYVRRWIQTRQLLAQDKTVDVTRELPLNCVLAWEGQPLPPQTLILARLPLPLVTGESGSFPFKTLEDATSPSLLQSLRLVK